MRNEELSRVELLKSVSHAKNWNPDGEGKCFEGSLEGISIKVGTCVNPKDKEDWGYYISAQCGATPLGFTYSSPHYDYQNSIALNEAYAIAKGKAQESQSEALSKAREILNGFSTGR